MSGGKALEKYGGCKKNVIQNKTYRENKKPLNVYYFDLY